MGWSGASSQAWKTSIILFVCRSAMNLWWRPYARLFDLYFWVHTHLIISKSVQCWALGFTLFFRPAVAAPSIVCEEKAKTFPLWKWFASEKGFFSTELCCCSTCRHTHARALFIFYHCRTAVRACNYSCSHMRCQDQTIRLKVFVVEKRKRIESHSHLKMRLQKT